MIRKYFNYSKVSFFCVTRRLYIIKIDVFLIKKVPGYVHLVEESLPSLSYQEHILSQNQEQTPIYLLTNSIGTDIQESSLEEIQLVHEKSYMPEHQVSQNIETVRVLFDKNRKRNANNLKCCVYWQQHSLEDLVRFKCNYFL